MAITPLPTPPTRSDAASFASRGDAFMSALPTFVTEANATASAMDAALQTSMLGVTATSSTSLTIGTGSKTLTVETNKGFVVGMSLKIASTATPNNYMIGTVTSYTSGTGALAVNVDTVGGSGTIDAWTVSIATMGDIDVAGGATETTSAVDIALTAASERVQVINMTAAGKLVTLPDATTMSEGDISYIFRATGYNYLVLSNTGKFVGTAELGKVLHVYLVDNSTAGGTWSGQAMTDTNPGVGVGVASVFESASTSQIGSVWLDDDRCFVAYKDAGNSDYMTGRVLTKSGTIFVPGTPFVIVSSNCANIQCNLIGSDKVMIVYSDGAGVYGKAVAITISGTTSGTIGTPINISTTIAYDAHFHASCRLSDDAVFVCYPTATSNYTLSYMTAKVLSVSGTTITANTADTLHNVASNAPACTLLSSGKVLVSYEVKAAASSAICSISGTTVTHGTPVQFHAISINYNQLTALTSTKALALYANRVSPSNIYYCVLTISGTTVTYGPPVAFDGTSAQCPSGLVRTSDTTAIGMWTDAANYIILASLSVSYTTMTSTEFSTSQLIVGADNTCGSHLTRNANGDICCDYRVPSTSYGTALLLMG